jgi:H+/Cl- antiporter ClcA
VASVLAGALRIWWLGPGPLFPVTFTSPISLPQALVSAVPLGLLVGLAAAGLSRLMYGIEDGFEHICGRLRIHWMWWPAIGGIGIAIGGYIFPRALGVGYGNIAELLRGNAPLTLIVGILVVKSLMWAFSLGSGTSGGVLAPLLMIGAAIGEGAALLLHMPSDTQALWALLGMASMLAAALGVPLTAMLFALELTHALPAMLPLVLACAVSYLVTSLMMPRSILTEKLSRRGYHLSREYGVDPLETITVREVMSELLPPDMLNESADEDLPENCAFSDETCRAVAEEMAANGHAMMVVVDRETGRPCGSIGVTELLAGRRRAIQRESERSIAFQMTGN